MDPLRRVADAVLALTVLGSTAAILAQVVCRYVLRDPIGWLDEFAVLSFAWMTLVGSAVVQRDDAHISIDTLPRMLPARAQPAFWAIRVSAMALVLGVLFWQGLQLTSRMSFIEYPAMGVSRSWLYAILPVGVPLIVYYLARTVRDDLRALRARERLLDRRGSGELL